MTMARMMNAATPARTAGCANVSSHEGPPRHLLLGILILIATEKDCRVRLLAAAHSVRRAGTLNSYLCDAASDKPAVSLNYKGRVGCSHCNAAATWLRP